MSDPHEKSGTGESQRRAECRTRNLERRVAPAARHKRRFTNELGGVRSALGNFGEAVLVQQGDGSAIDGEDPLIAKDTE